MNIIEDMQSLYHILQCRVDTFLDPPSLLELCCVNQMAYGQVKDAIQERKRTLFHDTIYYLYYCNEAAARKKLDLRRRYDTIYEESIRALFYLLPELFQFLQDHRVQVLAMGLMDSRVDGTTRATSTLFPPADRQQICRQFLTLLSQNTTLVSCNAEFFYDIMDRNQLVEAIRQHPTLQVVTLSSWSNNPHTLWRAQDGSFYWAERPRS